MIEITGVDYKKATQAINFLTVEKGGKANKMWLIKLIWLADRYHLRRYGRPVTGDNYFAMENGPVGFAVRDIAEQKASFLSEDEKKYSAKYVKPVTKYMIESLEEPDLDVLSESDVEALKFAFDKFGSLDQSQLRELSHKFPEWSRFEKELGRLSRVNMSYLDFFNDPQESEYKSYFQEDKQLIEQNKEIFEDRQKIAEQLV